MTNLIITHFIPNPPNVALIFIQTTHINVGPYSYSNRADDPVIGVDW